MNVELSSEQVLLQETVARIVQSTLSKNSEDGHVLNDLLPFRALADAGYLSVYTGNSALDATLVSEQAELHAVLAPVAASAIVYPALLGDDASRLIVGLRMDNSDSLVRYGDECDVVLTLAGDRAILSEGSQLDVQRIPSRWGYPLARVKLQGGKDLGAGSGTVLRAAWSLAIAVEIAGSMTAAVRIAAQHVTTREQFGRPLGSMQAVQHRLARSHVWAQATTWMARYAASDPGDTLRATTAGTYALSHAGKVIENVHQVAGAIGITREFALARHTSRLMVLQTELGGGSGAARWLAQAKWPQFQDQWADTASLISSGL